MKTTKVSNIRVAKGFISVLEKFGLMIDIESASIIWPAIWGDPRIVKLIHTHIRRGHGKTKTNN